MLKEPFQDKRQKQRLFQSVFLSNDRSQEVMIIEDENIDFEEGQKHLDNGGSVFITSKNSQKVRFDDQVERKSRKPKKNQIE
jgi:hypothetical protein